VMTQHAADIAACTEIGALIGGASTVLARRFRDFWPRLGDVALVE